ncbi:MAG: 23S rRNA (pseudouridine(1915)-N(3))-methyltransferase RlmH [Amphiplicatus sp.]
MRLCIAAVGKLRSGAEAGLVADYAARIAATGRSIGFSEFKIIEIEAPKGLDGAMRQTREAALLLAAAPPGKRVILDERGADLASIDMARRLGGWRDDGVGDAVFFIGGADGLGRALRDDADLALAFGRATWPHLLVRAMLCEQIYRAMTILAGHPYHRA